MATHPLSHALALGLLLLVPAVAAGDDFYIDVVSGSDTSGNGSATAPWRTVTGALTRIAPCSVVAIDLRLAPGVHDAAAGEQFPIVLAVDACLTAVTVHGSSSGTTEFRSEGRDGFRLVGFDGYGNLTLRSLHIVGGTASGRAGTGVDATGTDGPTVWYSRIEGFADGIVAGGPRVDGAGNALDQVPMLDGNWLRNNDRALVFDAEGRDPLYPAYVNGSAINNVLEDNGTGITVIARCKGCNGMVVEPALRFNTIVRSSGSGILVTLPDPGGPAATCPFITNTIVAWAGAWGVDDLVGGVCDHGAMVFWQCALGTSSTGTLPAFSYIDDPLFVSAAGSDYHLQAGSVAIDHGSPRIPINWDHDLEVRPQGAGYDIGAYEGVSPAARFDLLRADLVTISPLDPPLATVFPFAVGNPLTPVVRSNPRTGDQDTPPASTPLSLYQTVPDPSPALLLTKGTAGAVTITLP